MELTDLKICNFPAADCDTDNLITAVTLLKTEIQSRAKAELKTMETRRQAIMDFLNESPSDEPKPRTPAKPKYRNLDNPAITWTGRGKKPEWMSAWIASGKDPNDLLIAE